MKLVVFGLTVSSSWGNTHASVWRGLCTSLAKLGVQVVFFEKDLSFHAKHRDLTTLSHGELCLYEDFKDALTHARWHLLDADAAIVTSSCPDALEASRLILSAQRPLKIFYDLDAPQTLAALEHNEPIPYLLHEGLVSFDLLLSTTGGVALAELGRRLGASKRYPLYRGVDTDTFYPVEPWPRTRAALAHLATYSVDLHAPLSDLLLAPAVLAQEHPFLVGGSRYPANFNWPPNVTQARHVPTAKQPGFYAGARAALSLASKNAARLGYSPSNSLFEAAAVGVPVISNAWEGLDHFLTPQREVLVANSTADVLRFLEISDQELLRIGLAGHERVLAEHTYYERARELVDVLNSLKAGYGPHLVSNGPLRKTYV